MINVKKTAAVLAWASISILASAKPVVVAERFFTPLDEESNVDSIAVWHQANNATRWLIGTSKASHKLFVYDAQNGFPLSEIGSPGPELGQFQRPNGIAVVDDILLVVERDNHRVQVLTLPDFTPIGAFGTAELIKPYGLYIRKMEANRYQVYVSDDYNTTSPGKPEPNPDGIRKRIKRFEVSISDGAIESTLVNAFGEHTGPDALDIVESLMGDEQTNRLMVADEDETNGLEIHVFDLEGNDTGKRLGKGTFQFQPEGIALWETSPKRGYWIFTDQGKQSNYYHLYDRQSLKYKGSFSGERTLNTDGVAIDLKPSARYPQGVFYGIHDDSGVSAWSVSDIARALKLR